MSYPNVSQAFHADLKFDQFDHTDLSLIDHSGMAGTARYGNAGQYSPKQLVQMGDIYPIPDGSSSIPQNDSWGSSFHMSSADHPWARPGIKTVPNVRMKSPLPFRDSGYETTNKSDNGIHPDETPTSLPIDKNDKSFAKWQNEGFRFCAVLGAPTAMARNSEDPTLSYLNKGQAYKLSISDSKPPVASGQAKRYRAFVRVAFDQEQSRSNPAACWRLWREARAMNRSPRKEGIPFAVEFAGPASSDFQCQIEQEFFDGFCITWEMDHVTGFNICNISLRLHFLSTDFTRSKGVKGTPIRLCVKIQELTFPVNSPKPEDPKSEGPEICFCKIQLFRDHGAERKMSIDNGNLTKAIERLKQTMSSAMLEPVAKKRKRGRASESTNQDVRAPKLGMQKPSNHGTNSKLVELEYMALSTQPRTILAFRGSREDDPDLYPVHMPDYQESDLYSEISSANTMTTKSKDSGSERCTPIDADNSEGEKAGVHRIRGNQKQCMGFTSSAISTEQPPSLVACFYVRLMPESSQQFYRAIYLSERTTHDLTQAISTKYGITRPDGFNIFHVGDKDLKILVDDGFVQQMPEGQQMDIQLDENAALDGYTKSCAMRLLY
ncbi:CP2 transcription factor [Penicillium sp. IBT 16267x]|nr:CP2 transcription factor [Penicillium sp. IBT 16267x]